MHMRRVRSRLRTPLDHGGGFDIQVFDETPRFSAYLVNADTADGVAVVQSYLRRARGMEAPVLVLRAGARDLVHGDGGGDMGLFDTYREEFESFWADSRPVS